MKLASSIFVSFLDPEDGSSKFLRINDRLLIECVRLEVISAVVMDVPIFRYIELRSLYMHRRFGGTALYHSR
jgi:hypothetical protein